jgi:hypothetical protein
MSSIGPVPDPNDPAAGCALARALWLRREHGGAVSELDESIRSSPNYPLAHYTLSFVLCQQFESAFHMMDDLKEIYSKAAKRVRIPD